MSVSLCLPTAYVQTACTYALPPICEGKGLLNAYLSVCNSFPNNGTMHIFDCCPCMYVLYTVCLPSDTWCRITDTLSPLKYTAMSSGAEMRFFASTLFCHLLFLCVVFLSFSLSVFFCKATLLLSAVGSHPGALQANSTSSKTAHISSMLTSDTHSLFQHAMTIDRVRECVLASGCVCLCVLVCHCTTLVELDDLMHVAIERRGCRRSHTC